MKKLFIVANWKSNKDSIQVKDWIEGFKNYDSGFKNENKEVIVCPPFVHLNILKSYILNHKSNIELGAQDVSPFDEGAYTGEVNAKQIKEFGDYVIIGHSERRQNFNENEELIIKKIDMALKYDLTPILCISELSQISKLKTQNYSAKLKTLIIAYEPLFAIGSGSPDSPENAENIAKQIKQELGKVYVLYGGSVKSENVNNFTKRENIDGVLVGNASLDAMEFSKIIENA